MRYFLTLSILLFSLSIHGQQVEFTINIGSKEIGEITANKELIQNREVYKVVSDATFRIIWKYHRTSEMTVIYINDTLESSVSINKMNDDVKALSKFWKDDNGYKCHHQDKIEMEENPVLFSTVKLYFQEPVNVDSVYSETFLEMSYLEDLGDHRYKLFLPGNRKNTYRYDNGILQEVKVDRTFDILFKKKF